MRIFFAAILLVSWRCPSAPAQSDESEAINAIIHEALKFWHVPGVAVGIVQDDKIHGA